MLEGSSSACNLAACRANPLNRQKQRQHHQLILDPQTLQMSRVGRSDRVTRAVGAKLAV
jgi:hypothetical protein